MQAIRCKLADVKADWWPPPVRSRNIPHFIINQCLVGYRGSARLHLGHFLFVL